MIKYMLKCAHAHEFETWFGHSRDFDDQAARGLIACPYCENTKIEKAPMAPSVRTSNKTTNPHEDMVAKMRKNIADNFDNVGEGFADEARAIHYGDAPERSIYGQTTPEQARELSEEGIDALPLPDILAPRTKRKLN
ncbi:MAG: hypothetical protein COA69_05940 [Robiginitomaculum sp.]|nr:MAG: hypothetical protein COA69_05940 [Robiginitomaculum sp.]